MISLHQSVSAVAQFAFRLDDSLLCGFPEYCRVVNIIPALSPLDASSSILMTENVPRHCQMFPRGRVKITPLPFKNPALRIGLLFLLLPTELVMGKGMALSLYISTLY